MALGPIHCGSFLLLAATVLLVVASSEWRGSLTARMRIYEIKP
jgi:hypothetical protein